VPVTETALSEVLDEVSGRVASIPSDAEQAAELAPSPARVRILVVEDVEANQIIARDMLQVLGCDVDVANNGKQALERFTSGEYDLVFMDCQMPVMDGYEATGAIREHEAAMGSEAVPVVAMTAGFNAEEEARCLGAGMSACLAKPYTMAELSSSLEGTLGGNFSAAGLQVEQPSSIPTSKKNAATIDRSVIENLQQLERQTGRPLVDSILDSFKSHFESQLPQLDTCYQERDGDGFFKIAHSLKSSSGSVGALGIAHLCERYEELGRQQQLELLDDPARELEGSYRHYLEVFELEFPAA
jgi:CheY-like chemotaxis protein